MALAPDRPQACMGLMSELRMRIIHTHCYDFELLTLSQQCTPEEVGHGHVNSTLVRAPPMRLYSELVSQFLKPEYSR